MSRTYDFKGPEEGAAAFLVRMIRISVNDARFYLAGARREFPASFRTQVAGTGKTVTITARHEEIVRYEIFLP